MSRTPRLALVLAVGLLVVPGVALAHPVVVPAVPEATSELVVRFTRLGIAHVLGGLDHVLFLVALAWQVLGRPERGGLAELARAATVFTVAHAISLAATALDTMHVPSAMAEAAIAASLVLVALGVGRTRSVGARAELLLVAVFGLVHGLGFASGLADAGLPGDRRLVGLVSFNVGVEIAQLVILGAAVLVARVVPRAVRRADLQDRVARTSSTLSAYAIGVTGAWLFFSRLLPFRGP